jgi:hypothetical protein
MAFTVLLVPEVRRTVENELSKGERGAYDAAVDALRGEGLLRRSRCSSNPDVRFGGVRVEQRGYGFAETELGER